MNPLDLDEEELEEALSEPAPSTDSAALQAIREQRDSDIAQANMMQGLTSIGAGLASRGRVKPDPAVFEAVRAAAQTRAKEGGTDVAAARKAASEAVRAKIAEDWKKANFEQRERGIEATRINRKEAGDRHATERSEDKAEKVAREAAEKAEKEAQLTTTFGMANTADDAKKLKDASVLKDKFDRSLQEMIDLRTKYGSEVANQEVVGRAKKLSSDLLLLQKDLANLGVLSKSDEKILRTIIPENPLTYDMAQVIGQDPIMTGLKKYQGDVKSDFESNLKSRLRPGTLKMPQPDAEREAALKWLQENPNDERAPAVKKKLGL